MLELGGAEAEHLVPGDLELAVGPDAVGVHGGVRVPVGAVVGGAVYLEDDPVAVGQQEQEVHAEPQQGLRAALAGCLGVPVQPDLGQERREEDKRWLTRTQSSSDSDDELVERGAARPP
jgi:hypothetical protein